jgi:hypothetical protein
MRTALGNIVTSAKNTSFDIEALRRKQDKRRRKHAAQTRARAAKKREAAAAKDQQRYAEAMSDKAARETQLLKARELGIAEGRRLEREEQGAPVFRNINLDDDPT